MVRGIEKKLRRIYNLDMEKKAPDVVIELTSRHTKVEDPGNKRVIYAALGVAEYFLFDPLDGSLSPQLRGFRLQGGEYIPMLGTRLTSEVLGLVVEDDRLRLYNPRTTERLRTHAEAEAVRREAEDAQRQAEAAWQEAEAAQRQAEAENLRLREELARLRARQG